METELFKKLLTDPVGLLWILPVAVLLIFVVKLVNFVCDSVVKRLVRELKQKKGLLWIVRVIAQVVVIALILSIANAMYWTHQLPKLLPSPTEKPINSCEATVEIVIESEGRDTTYQHFLDRGGYLAFGLGNQPLLVTLAGESWGGAVGTNEYISRGVFKMSMTDSAAGKPVALLRGAEYVQVEFPRLPKEYNLVRGKAICVINGEIRFEIAFPPQKAKDGKVYVRDLKPLEEVLK